MKIPFLPLTVVTLLTGISLGQWLFVSACGRPTITLPPLNYGTPEPPADPNSDRVEDREPGIPILYTLYLSGQKISIDKEGQQSACFNNIGNPCDGKVRTSDKRTVTISSTDFCILTNPTGFVHLTVRNEKAELLFDVYIPAPDPNTLTSIPTQIGDSQNRAVLNGECYL